MAHIIQDDGFDGGNEDARPLYDDGTMLDINFGSLRFLVEGVMETLLFVHHRPQNRLILRSSSRQSHFSGYSPEEATRLMTDLFSQLSTGFRFESIRLTNFSFEIPIRSLAQLVQQSKSTLQHLALTDMFLSGFEEEASVQALLAALSDLPNLETVHLVAGVSIGRNPAALRVLYNRIACAVASQARHLSIDLVDLIDPAEIMRHFPPWAFLAQDGSDILDAMHETELEFVRALGRVLEQPNIVLEQLNLSLFDLRSIQPVMTALKENRSLKAIAFGRHGDGPPPDLFPPQFLLPPLPVAARMLLPAPPPPPGHQPPRGRQRPQRGFLPPPPPGPLPPPPLPFPAPQPSPPYQQLLPAAQAARDMLISNCIVEQITVEGNPDQLLGPFGLNNNSRVVSFAELPTVDDPLIALYLKLNQAGRHHLLESGQATRQDWIDAISDNRDDTKVVHYFLSQNPSLCEAV